MHLLHISEDKVTAAVKGEAATPESRSADDRPAVVDDDDGRLDAAIPARKADGMKAHSLARRQLVGNDRVRAGLADQDVVAIVHFIAGHALKPGCKVRILGHTDHCPQPRHMLHARVEHSDQIHGIAGQRRLGQVRGRAEAGRLNVDKVARLGKRLLQRPLAVSPSKG